MTTVFAYNFEVPTAADMVVYADGVVVPASSYTLAGVGVQAGGTVTFSVAPVNGTVILLNREIALQRTTGYQTLGDFRASVVNPDFNRLWMALQGFNAVQGGAIRVPYPTQINELPDPALFPGYFIGVDGSGQPTFLLAPSGTAGALASDLADSTNAAKGDALVALKRTATGAVATTGHAWHDRQTFNVKDFGALGDGATDDSTAIELTISAAIVRGGGIVQFGSGVFVCSTDIMLDEQFGITLAGEGCSPTIHNNGTVLKFTGSVGPFISVRSSHQITLRDLRIVHSNAGFSGYLVDGSQSIASDTSGLLIDRCSFGSYTGLLHTASGLQFDKVISSTVRDCTFDSLATAIDGQSPAGGSYANVITVQNCHFGDITNVPVRYCGETWSFLGNTFEPRVGGIAGAIETTALTPVKGFEFSGNWLGDVSAGGSTWLILYGKAAEIRGNRFGGTAASTAISLNAFEGASVTGNAFVLFSTAISFGTAGCTDFIEHSNDFDTCTSIFGSLANQDSFSVGTVGHSILPNGMLMQYGRATVTTGTPLAITFNKAFTNANYAFTPTLYAPSGAGNTVYATSIGTTGITLNVNGTAGASVVHWHAIGQA